MRARDARRRTKGFRLGGCARSAGDLSYQSGIAFEHMRLNAKIGAEEGYIERELDSGVAQRQKRDGERRAHCIPPSRAPSAVPHVLQSDRLIRI